MQDKILDIINYRAAEKNESGRAKEYLDILSAPIYDSVVAEEKINALKLSVNFSKLSLKMVNVTARRHL